MAENVIYKLSKRFALRIIKLYTFLCDEKKNMLYQNSFIEVEQALALILQKVYMLKVMQIMCIS